MSETTSAPLNTTRRLSGRARAGVLGGVGLAAAVAATLVISGTAGATAADEPHTPSSMVVEGSGASDAVGVADPATGVTVIDGDMLIAPPHRRPLRPVRPPARLALPARAPRTPR